MATALLARGHVVHVLVFGVPVVALAVVIGLQEIRGRRALHSNGEAAADSPAMHNSAHLDGKSLGLRAAAGGLIAAAAAHAVVIPEHFHEYLLYGVFFSVLTALQIALAVLVTVRPNYRLVRYVAIASAWVVALYFVSRTSGVPIGPEPWQAESFGALDLAATLAELVTLTGCLMQLRRAPKPSRWLAPGYELTR